MVKSLDLAEINDLADSGAYGGNRVLSPTSAATILCAGVWLSDLRNWQGAGYDLTQAEIDEIEALVAVLQFETMTEGEDELGDFIKIAETVVTTDSAEVYVDDFTSGDYIAFKLVIQGLLSNYSGSWADHVELEINNSQVNGSYSSYGRFFYNTTPINYENILNYPANLLYWCSSAAQASDGIWGGAELIIYQPQVVGHKSFSYVGLNAGYVAIRLSNTIGTCGVFIAAAISKILIRPYNGTSFMVGGGNEPPELTMSLYGMK